MIIHSSWRFQQKYHRQSPEQWLRESSQPPPPHPPCSEEWSLPSRRCDEIKSLPESRSLSSQQKEENHIKITPNFTSFLGRGQKSHFHSFVINWSLSFSFLPVVTDYYKFDHTNTGLLLNYHSARRMGMPPPPPQGNLRTWTIKGVY